MTDVADEVIETMRQRVTPSPAEREHLESVVASIIERTEATVASLPVEADVIRVGSTARRTWTVDDRDIDVFIRFPPSLSRADLERFGLEVGRAVLPDGREEFAEHPYVTGSVDGFDVDIVPCYRVAGAGEAKSAVDRTPFHTEYIRSNLPVRLAVEVRLLKTFLRATGIYGSDLRTRGFSGYLTELLVLEHDDFLGVVSAVADWRPPVILDPADHGSRKFEDPLIVYDPTDSDRNVAAVCSPTNVARFQHHARRFLAEPSTDRFDRHVPDPMSVDSLLSHITDRGTGLIAIRFDAPDIVEDQLYPQLVKSVHGIQRSLNRRDFSTIRTDYAADDVGDSGQAIMLFELEQLQLPAVRRHDGPPVSVRDHAETFYSKYENADVYGPYVDGDRYVIERSRDVRSAVTFFETDRIFDASLGVDIAQSLENGYSVLVDDELTDLLEVPSFGRLLAEYFSPGP